MTLFIHVIDSLLNIPQSMIIIGDDLTDYLNYDVLTISSELSEALTKNSIHENNWNINLIKMSDKSVIKERYLNKIRVVYHPDPGGFLSAQLNKEYWMKASSGVMDCFNTGVIAENTLKRMLDKVIDKSG